MSDLPNSSINIINTRDKVDSAPHRQNYEAIRQAVSDNYRRITNTLTAGPSEVTDARDGTSSLQENIRIRAGYGDVIENRSQLVPTSNSDNTIQGGAGRAIINGIGVEVTSQTSSAISPAAAGNHKRISLVLNSNSTYSIAEGAEVLTSAEPPFAALTSSQMLIATSIIDETSPVVISQSDIVDERYNYLEIFDKRPLHDYGAVATYDGSDRISTITYTDRKGNTIDFAYTYTGDNLTEIEITDGGETLTTTITYDGSDNVSGQSIVYTP